MFRAIGGLLDAGEAERELFGDLASWLWTGSFARSSAATGTVRQPYAVKDRLECMLRKAKEIREKYHEELYEAQKIADLDFKRSLQKWEQIDLHNQWMNDVASWMSPDCLQEYNEHIWEATRREKGKGKGKGNAGKLAKGTKKGVGPRQQAQQLKKQRFNKVINDIAGKKGFFMCLLRHPCVVTVEGIKDLLQELVELKESKEYRVMLDVSREKTEEVATLKRKRHETRLALKRGRHDYDDNLKTRQAYSFARGDLQQEVDDAETAYGARKQVGVAWFLGPRMGE
jgi:hypothetical protein